MPEALVPVPAPTELTSFILAEVQRQTSEDALRKIVETKIGAAVMSAVDDAFKSYGHVGKQISKAVENSLSIGDRIDVPSYSNMVMALLRAKLDETVSDFVNKKLAEEMGEILHIAPKEVKFSDVLEDLREHAKEYSGKSFGRISVLIESGHGGSGTYWVGLDEDGDKTRRHECETQFAVDKDGKIFSLTIERREVGKVIRMGPYWGYQKMLFGAYACGSRLIMDEFDPSLSYGDDY